jgi:hypothetical protein
MATCDLCRKSFEVSETRDEYNWHFRKAGGVDYDEQYPSDEGSACASCAISQSESFMNTGAAILMVNGELDYDDEHVTDFL